MKVKINRKQALLYSVRVQSGVNAAGVTGSGVRTPQYLTCMGPSMCYCWTPAIIPTQSRVRCTIFVNIDFVVSAAVEQVYSIPLSSVC